MASYYHMLLTAVHPERNLHRVYTIHLTKGLFESWVVLIGYGRFGAIGQQKNYGFKTKEEALIFINKRRHKRLHAEKRIGCNYTIVHELESADIEMLKDESSLKKIHV